MIVTLLSGVVVGGIVSGCVEAHKAKKEREKLQEQLRIQQAKDRKLKLQVEFFDAFRELDNKLARVVREGFKGVTYLINGVAAVRFNYRLIEALKNVRNYRGRLTHDKTKWVYIPAPTPSIMKDLYYAQAWVERNYSAAAKLVWKGREAFSKSNDMQNKTVNQENIHLNKHYGNNCKRRTYNRPYASKTSSRNYSASYYNKKAN